MPGTVQLDEAFTQKALQLALLRNNPVLHIASYFQFQPGNETDSFLLLGDGNKLSIADLKGYRFAGVDLLTLSACATVVGGGTGTEIESFAMLMMRQGAKAVLLPLWAIADDSTKEFMLRFYQSWVSQSNLSKAEALRQTQLAFLHGQVQGKQTDTHRGVMSENAASQQAEGQTITLQRFTPAPDARYAHPYYWAPFILIGNWL